MSWTEHEQKDVKSLREEYGCLFVLDDMDLGKTSMVKYSIKLTDATPFKERYRCIPPHQCEEVRKYMLEMLDIGAIHGSNSSWASMVVLVRKKDGSLHFCIDLCKLCNMVKDAYSLLRKDKCLDCFNETWIFTILCRFLILLVKS